MYNHLPIQTACLCALYIRATGAILVLDMHTRMLYMAYKMHIALGLSILYAIMLSCPCLNH